VPKERPSILSAKELLEKRVALTRCHFTLPSPPNWLLGQPKHFSAWMRIKRPFVSSTLGLLDNGLNRFFMQRRHQAIPLQQAAQESPTLATLMDRVRDSSLRLQAVKSLLPAPLRSSIQAGPLEEGCWCLLVASNAVAAKLRQLLPALQAHLIQQNLGVLSIRIKVQNR
jgi:hypothetical protein